MSAPRAVIILAGGAGTRLWPLSTDENPKQFLQLFDGRSLFQMSFERVRQIVPPEHVFVSTNARYRDKITAQIPDLPAANILAEPARRNTAPAIAACCAEIERRLPGAVIGIVASDHYVGNVPAFVAAVQTAFSFAEESDYLVTIGIKPTEPNTGFGYLETGEELGAGVKRVLRYIEKPTRERAAELIGQPRFVWNGGSFFWKVNVFQAVLQQVAPEVAELSRRLLMTANEGERRTLYEAMPQISIDFGVMEHAKRVATVPAEFGWSDVGTWSSVARLARSDGGALVEGGQNVYVRTTGDRPVAVVGLSNLAVIDGPEGLLVVDLESAERVSDVVKRLGEKK